MNARTLRSATSSRRMSSCIALAAFLCSNVVHAQGDTGAAETAAARTLAVEGVKLALAHRCDDALDKLDRAQKLKPSPIVLRHLGECQIELGRWVEGSESLRKLLRDPMPEDASPAVEQAYEGAAATLRELKPRIPSMKIVVNGPRDVDVVVKVDGKEIANSVVGVPLPADPGDHVIEATAPGFLQATSSVKLAPGSTQTVTVDLKRDPSWLRPPRAAQASRSAALPPTDPSSKPRENAASAATTSSSTAKTLGYLSYGVAAAGLGVGIAFGQSAMKDERELRESCPNQVCSEEDRDSLEFAKTKGTIATIGFATAGAGIALGTVLVLTAPSAGSSAPAGSTARRRTVSPTFHPRAKIGLGRITLATDF